MGDAAGCVGTNRCGGDGLCPEALGQRGIARLYAGRLGIILLDIGKEIISGIGRQTRYGFVKTTVCGAKVYSVENLGSVCLEGTDVRVGPVNETCLGNSTSRSGPGARQGCPCRAADRRITGRYRGCRPGVSLPGSASIGGLCYYKIIDTNRIGG